MQQRELKKMHQTGEYTISDLGELFSVSRPNGVPSPASVRRLGQLQGLVTSSSSKRWESS